MAMTLSFCGQQLRSIGSDGTDEAGTSSAPLAVSGDIVVSNGLSDSVLLLDSDGFYKALLYNFDNTAESPFGVTYNSVTNEAVIAVDGADRVMAVSLTDGSSRNFITNGNLTGTIRNLTQLLSGDFLILESNNIERFTKDGIRIGSGGWPITNIQTNPSGIFRRSGGGFGVCSYGTDAVRLYDESGTQEYTASSGIAGTGDGLGCIEMSNGNIAVIWSGSTDTVQIRSPDLSSVVASYSNISILGDPEGIAQDNEGNLLVTDGTFHHIVVVNPSGNLVTVKGNSVLNWARSLFVVP